MNKLIDFFTSPFFSIIGGISTILMMCGFLYTIWLVIKGVIPVWYRLGHGLSMSKIAIFASDEFTSLNDMLVDSKIFKRKNIIKIHKNDLKKSVTASIFLVHWKEFEHELSNIIDIKRDNIAMIVYAPQDEGKIPEPDLQRINQQRNSLVVNFRGRLLNDILISLVTVNYEQ